MTTLVLLALLIPLVVSQDCSQLAESGDCTFYSSCVEDRIPCGDLGYALNYGKRYCEAFAAHYDNFNDNGKRWIGGVRSCLMKAILTSNVYINFGTCEVLKNFAYESHPKCYVDSGFCSDILLDATNLRGLFGLFRNHPSGITSNIALSLNQVIKTGIRCARFGIGRIRNTLEGFIVNAVNAYEEFLLDLKESFSSACYRDIDVLFLMDSSGSIGASNYAIMKDFVADVLVTFNITQKSRIAILTFTTVPTTIISLATVSDVNALAATVRNITYPRGGTYTDLALNTSLDVLTGEDNIRIGILLTDGQSNRPELTLIAAAAVHAAGIEMYTFGIGNTNPAELEAIASEPNADYSFYISSFNRSSFNELLLLLARQTCTTPEQGHHNEDSIHTVGESESTYVVYPFDVDGITIECDVSNGGIEVYGSFLVRNPGRTTSDFSFTADHSVSYFVSPETFEESTGIQLGTARSKRETTNQTTTSYNVHLTIVGKSPSNNFMIRTVAGNAVPPNTVTNPVPTNLPKEEIYIITIACLLAVLCVTWNMCLYMMACLCWRKLRKGNTQYNERNLNEMSNRSKGFSNPRFI